jgi:hypothetical protein
MASRDLAPDNCRGDHSAARVATPEQLLNGKPLRVIVHAPIYMVGRAADLAARQFATGVFEEHSLIGIVSGDHAFTLKRTKAGVSVWHFRTNGSVPSEGWEAG